MGGPLVIGSNATDRLGAPSVYLDAKAKVAAGAISSCNTALLPGNVWTGTATKTGTNSKCSEYGDDPIQMSLQVLSSDFAGDATLQGATNYGAAAVGSAEYACTVTSQYSMVLREYSGTYVQWRFIRSIGVLADIAAHRCRSLRGVLVDISTNIESPTVYSFAGGECVNRTHVRNLFLVSRDMCVSICVYEVARSSKLSLSLSLQRICVSFRNCVFLF